MASQDLALIHAVIDTYRTQFQRRYDLKNVRRFTALDAIEDEKINALREFFLRYLYPPAQERDKLDAAADRVGQIFRSPRRLLPLMGLAMGSLWSLGTLIPKAAAVTATTLDSLIETRKLEAHMLRFAKTNKLPPGKVGTAANIAKMVASIPEREMLRFRNDILKLFRSLMNASLLETGVDIMGRAITLMERKPNVYGQHELEGFQLGREVLIGCCGLYRQLTPEEAIVIVDGIEQIEIDWYERMKEKAAKAEA